MPTTRRPSWPTPRTARACRWRTGAPLRLRVEQQLGYKQAKYLMGIEVVDAHSGLWGGKGGCWEDRGCEWYAGI